MKSQFRHIGQTVVCGVCLWTLSLLCWFHTPQQVSESERRELASFPSISVDTIVSGEFMSDFEDYTVDQFPARDSWRALKALTSQAVFGQLDNNGIYVSDGIVGKIEYPINESSLTAACDTFRSIYERYLQNTDTTPYLAVIPDKNAFIAEESGRLSMDYHAFYAQIQAQTEFAAYIDIAPLLGIEDYYATDTHWKQEAILDVADTLADAMGVTLPQEYTLQTLDTPFYGVYYGQAALPIEADTITYVTSDIIDSFAVYDHQNERDIEVYDLHKADGADPYELFLSGSLSLVTIRNPQAASDKELVVFRDSFGSSLVPLLAQGYRCVTLVDIRYLPSAMLDRYLTFDDQDVLFLYSTLVLNNSNTLK